MIDPDPTDAHEWRTSALNESRRRDALAHAPDCRDPDHPGCEKCEPQQDEDDDRTDQAG